MKKQDNTVFLINDFLINKKKMPDRDKYIKIMNNLFTVFIILMSILLTPPDDFFRLS